MKILRFSDIFAKHIHSLFKLLFVISQTLPYVSLPKYWRELLRCASDGGHGVSIPTLVVGVEELVLGLAKINQLQFAVVEQKEVRRLYVPVTDSPLLQK